MSTRREFLVLASMTAATAAAMGPKLFAAQSRPAAESTLAVGFAPLAAGTLIDAARVSGGSLIGQSARISLLAGARNARRVRELRARFPYPFIFWARGGRSVRFRMPVDLDQKPAFDVVLDTATTHSMTMTKPVPGFYVLVPLAANETAPRWSSYELRNEAGRWTIFDWAGEPAPFEHFLLRID